MQLSSQNYSSVENSNNNLNIDIDGNSVPNSESFGFSL